MVAGTTATRSWTTWPAAPRPTCRCGSAPSASQADSCRNPGLRKTVATVERLVDPGMTSTPVMRGRPAVQPARHDVRRLRQDRRATRTSGWSIVFDRRGTGDPGQPPSVTDSSREHRPLAPGDVPLGSAASTGPRFRRSAVGLGVTSGLWC